MLIVERGRIAEPALRSRCVEPRFASPERTAGQRDGKVRIAGRLQRYQIDGPAERIAAVGILRPQSLGDVERGKRGNGKAREVDVPGVAVVEQLAVERDERF